MSKFIPRLVNEDFGTFLIHDNPFAIDEGIRYAKDHNLDIKFTCGNYTCATEAYYKLQQAGYGLRFVKRDIGEDVNCDIAVYDTVYCYFGGCKR